MKRLRVSYLSSIDTEHGAREIVIRARLHLRRVCNARPMTNTEQCGTTQKSVVVHTVEPCVPSLTKERSGRIYEKAAYLENSYSAGCSEQPWDLGFL